MDLLVDLNLLGTSPAFVEAVRLLNRFASCDATVLLQGETGTGKEVAARAIHHLGSRRDRPFVPVNCGALPDNLLEAELFGHERGAFTDARERRQGMVSQAEGGTLFLDEIEAMSPRAQVVLLRFLQDHSYRPVGGRLTRCENLRVIAASNVDLKELVARDRFRSDLLYRLSVLTVTMPPLRERGGDALLLAESFLSRYAQQYGRGEKRLHPDTAHWLTRYPWPGNIRELENLLLREFLLSERDALEIAPPDPAYAATSGAGPLSGRESDPGFRKAKASAVAAFERSYLENLLNRTRGNLSQAARVSRKDRSTLARLVKKHGIEISRFRF